VKGAERLKSATEGSRAGARGALAGAAVGPLAFALHAGWNFRTGLGAAVDGALAVLLAALAVGGLALAARGLAQALLRLGRSLRERSWVPFAAMAGAVGVLAALLRMSYVDAALADPGAVGLVVLETLTGGCLGWLIGGGLRRASRRRAVAALGALALGVAANLLLFGWLADPGPRGAAEPAAGEAEPVPALLADGPYQVTELTYGSGDDRRPEFGRRAAFRTERVDASPLLPPDQGWGAAARRWYWGFGPSRFPLNGRVWLPHGEGPFPLVLILHGNHAMEVPSDAGYAYLGRFLASRGYLVASVDENFLNVSPWAGDLPQEVDARAWILLKHLEVWKRWNETPGHPLARKVDLGRIGLIGQSRGGEAVAVAAALNRLAYYPDDARRIQLGFNFPIRTVIAIAPSDGRFEPADHGVSLAGVDYLVLQGANDADESVFKGIRQYRRVSWDPAPSPEAYRFKAAVYLGGANHSGFNTVWGDADLSPPRGWLLSRSTVMPGERQRRLAELYVLVFLEASLRSDRRYLSLFYDPAVAERWLPGGRRLSEFADSATAVVSDFEEDCDLASTTLPGGRLAGEGLAVWREQVLRFRDGNSQENHAVYLGWNNAPGTGRPAGPPGTYTVSLPAGWAARCGLDAASLLVMDLADSGETPDGGRREGSRLDFTLELTDDGGRMARLPLGRSVPLPVRGRWTKLAALDRAGYGDEIEVHLQTYTIPLANFVATGTGFDPAALRTIRFRFDRSPAGVVVLDDLGFRRHS
jgi:dienelactone hydrolase